MFARIKKSISILVLTCIVPSAYSQTITVKNKNCVYQGIVRTNKVKIRVWSPYDSDATGQTDDFWFELNAGDSKTVELADVQVLDDKRGKYSHTQKYMFEPEFTSGGKYIPTSGYDVTCQVTDWGVCVCDPTLKVQP